jgi:hypothetical protein
VIAVVLFITVMVILAVIPGFAIAGIAGLSSLMGSATPG